MVALSQCSLTARAVQLQAQDGRLYRLHRGVYSIIPPELLTRDGRYMAAVLACGPGAVLSHRSAAALHELRPTGTLIEVTVPGRAYRQRPGIRTHRSATLIERDVTRVNHIPVTTVARTLFDLAEGQAGRPLEKAFDQAEIRGILDLGAIHDQLARNLTRPPAKRVKAILEEHYIGTTMTVSELEEAFLKLAREVGLPAPEVNAWVDLHDGDPPIMGDFVWRAERIVVETDGHRTHGTRQAFEQDRRRDQRLILAGWRVVRTTWQQVMRRPWELRTLLRRLLAPG